MTLLAKLSPPTLSDGCKRETLLTLFRQRMGTNGLWIAGLPGAGKTTALKTYFTANAIVPFWYRCDESDQDPSTLFHFLALLCPDETARLSVFSPELKSGLAGFSRRFFQWLYAHLGQSFVIAFDNYQEASSQLINDVMQCAIDELPNDCSIVFLSRALPPIQFSRALANGAIGLVRPEDMRLTVEEAAEIIQAHQDVPVTENQVREIYRKTEGWAAGLVVLAAARNATAVSLAPNVADPAALFNYFAAEVFRTLSPVARHVLLMAALVPAPSADLVARLSGEADSCKILDDLFTNGYFVTVSSGGPRAYELHPLFRAFLISTGQVEIDAKALTDTKILAAELLEQAGQWEAAIDLISHGLAPQLFSRLLQRFGPMLVQQGRYATLSTWLGRLDDNACLREPWLLYWRATARLPTRLSSSQREFAEAFTAFEQVGDGRGVFAAWAAAVQALCTDAEGDYQRLDAWLEKFDTLSATYAELGNSAAAFDVAFSMYYALYFRAPQDQRASLWRKRAIELATLSDDPFKKANTIQRAVVHDLLIGNHARARLHMATFQSLEPEIAANARALAAIKYTAVYFFYRVGEFDAAIREMQSGLRIAAESGYSTWTHHLLSHGAAAAISGDDCVLADSLLGQLNRCNKSNSGFGAQYYHVLSAWNELNRGNMIMAGVHADEAVRLSYCTNHVLFDGCSAFASAIVNFHMGHGERAHALLEHALLIARRIESVILEHMCRLVEADFAFKEGKHPEAFCALGSGLALGREQRYNNFIFWLPAMMSRLCAHALEAGVETDYVKYIIRSRGLTAPHANAARWPWRVKLVTFDSFQVLVDDKPLAFGRKEPKKLLALLKAIVAFGGQEVPQDRLIDALWDDQDGDEAQMALDKAIQRLRKLLGENTLIYRGGRISLSPSLVWTDTAILTRAGDDAAMPDPGRLRRLGQALCQYRRPFLADDMDVTWALQVRQKHHSAFLSRLTNLARQWINLGDYNEALSLFEHGLTTDASNEALYQGAVYCYAMMRRDGEAKCMFDAMRCALEQAWHRQPAPLSMRLHDSLSFGNTCALASELFG